jgi:hypothetical protein
MSESEVPAGESMKPFRTIAVLIIGLIAVMQGIRFALGWSLLINGIAVPLWPSAVAFVVLGVIAVMLWREGRN